MNKFKVGQRVTWLYSPRGGYGYVFPIDGTVIGFGRGRVKIAVRKADGDLVERFVDEKHLKGQAMTFASFKQLVREQGWTLAQLRCDEPPPRDLLAVMDRLGLERYERFVLRLEREATRRLPQ